MRRNRRRRSERRVLGEDRLFEPPKVLYGLEAELVEQESPAAPVDLERLGLPTGAVQRQHQLAAQPLTERVLLDERFELRDRLLVPAERQLRVDPLFARRQQQLGQSPVLALRKRLVPEVGKRRSAALPEGLVEQFERPGGVLLFARPVQQRLEPVRVELHRLEAKPVTTGDGLEPVTALAE